MYPDFISDYELICFNGMGLQRIWQIIFNCVLYCLGTVADTCTPCRVAWTRLQGRPWCYNMWNFEDLFSYMRLLPQHSMLECSQNHLMLNKNPLTALPLAPWTLNVFCLHNGWCIEAMKKYHTDFLKFATKMIYAFSRSGRIYRERLISMTFR